MRAAASQRQCGTVSKYRPDLVVMCFEMQYIKWVFGREHETWRFD